MIKTLLSTFLLVLSFVAIAQASRCESEAYIFKYKSEKCNGCQGWYIALQEDTIKVSTIEELEENRGQLVFPVKAYITINNKIDDSSIDYPYYNLACIEVPCFDKATKDQHSGICPANLNPVCGCDGNTYGNNCGALEEGINILSRKM